MDAKDLLIPAGLKKGQKVLEVGCGPGFFTIPAAEIVGESGYVYAIDINPFAVKKVQKKLEKNKIQNALVTLEDIRKTSLEKDSIDLVFYFGVIHNLMNIFDEVINRESATGRISFHTPKSTGLDKSYQPTGNNLLNDIEPLTVSELSSWSDTSITSLDNLGREFSLYYQRTDSPPKPELKPFSISRDHMLIFLSVCCLVIFYAGFRWILRKNRMA